MYLWCQCSEEVNGKTQIPTSIQHNSLIIFSSKMACKIPKNLYQADTLKQADERLRLFQGRVSSHILRKTNLYPVDTSTKWTTAKIPYVSA